MRVVVQKAKASSVSVNGDVVGKIEQGLVLLVGITHEDTIKDVEFVADKVANLRIFEDEEGKMNYSVQETGGQILSISQFTLYGDCRKGRRPNFMAAARPEVAEPLYDQFNEVLRSKGLQVETGRFGAMMDVQIHNHGPVTLIVES
ncbi:D-aminoacyl-tRNA deacylase [Brevibacillus laterosporus]|uniref:D-aminoacyl-tRNA deacylase n=1 Tax=Brevibacillus laterosporus TaxID=1465 RepID=A0AAP3DDD3_BRELA|nr:D-aminoacyl-tRNA deacylase [Brevibacillus laterosporus]ATO50605.1 D-tyrosyl-tRNA(Tyr) deacylase [Brevibacillus laterosporus DSM 25]MBG9800292.1 D-tyrosyl-tRNA(Tyr) deacylase [Brevibacillus laterosporus]MBG9801956.1 D-tyrosyl-tRNA(Tyr) deacylase [Brevibacillus laterosporus]MCR8937976.1 D-aminoacyl-tRNA deacylase [Brevibacillus laterosporus]MCR8978831.1 D-aminoacyl-tRNA deacylase [Brevibacillus laterosporus]